MPNLTLKYHQINSEGIMLLPSAEGRAIIKSKLRSFKIEFEETMVRFCGQDVLAYKLKLVGTPQYLNIETRFKEAETQFFIVTYSGDRANFRLPMYV